MLLTSIKCSNCGAYHDATLQECPECHKNNELRTLKGFPKHVLFLHPIAQMAIFVIGFAYVGMLLGEIFFATFAPSILIVEILAYSSMVIGILSVILFTRRKMFLGEFKKYENYLIGLLFGVIAIGSGILLSLLISIWYKGDPNGNQEAAESIVTLYPIPAFLLFCILGPICEELTYRVGLYSLLRRFNKYLALILTTIVFAFIHFRFDNENMLSEYWSIPSYLLAGFLLTYAYERGGIASSMTAHIIYNIVSFIITLVQYGQQA